MRFRDLCAVVLISGLVIGIQAKSGAWTADFTTDEDEAGHAVSSLMVRDYIVHGLPQNPLRFAENYYVHYPKVAIGHWPPLFYTGEAVWMLVFGRSRMAMLTFVDLCALALLSSVFWWVKRDYGALAGFISVLALAAPAFMQSAFDSVSPNVPLALISFWAAMAFGRYLDSRRRRDAILFGALVLIAIGVHGRGAMLLLVPVVALFMGRFRWTPWRVGWMLVTLAAVFGVPRLLFQADAFRLAALPASAAQYFDRAASSMSWPVMILAITGAIFVIRDKTTPPRWIAMAALAVSGWIFHSAINIPWGDRYLCTAAPATAALCGAGFHFFLKNSFAIRLRAARSTAWSVVLALLICADLGWVGLPVLGKPDLGYHRLGELPGIVSLVAGYSTHEGAFVSEMALRDPHLNHIVLRGSKSLANSTWIQANYRPLFPDPSAVSTYLDLARVETVVIQQSYSKPHVLQLFEALRAEPKRWGVTQVPGEPSGVVIFRRMVPLPPGDPRIRIDMRYSLGRTLENGSQR
jgi:hypothetical protein